MRWRPWMWLSLSMLCFLAAVYFWQLGDKWAAQKRNVPAVNGTNQIQPADPATKPVSQKKPLSAPVGFALLSQVGHVNSLPARSSTNHASPLAYRLSNTTQPLRALVHNERAI